MQAVVEIDVGAVQIREARRIDDDRDAFAFVVGIVGFLLVERHAVLKAGTAARLDKDAQVPVGLGVRLHRANLSSGAWRECNHEPHPKNAGPPVKR